ncbi:putative protein with domain of unknown function (DUF1768) [Lyophyllum shimeji]|uniref:NADAR domain-containing protein n=1 Tax=Lyophyllum shimeji TaxID=47721 RepID=A0A9P3ULH8_LYOSH|nr:putative protein with domain of unknown function (DUF1768) [Lyophyllum shimeji]
MRGRDDYVFFWKTGGPNGWASQWYHSPFTATVHTECRERTVTFTSAEQWMMVQKALLFGDVEVARKMLAIRETDSKAMAEIKALGRQVKHFDEMKWNAERERIVLQGNLLKFRQDEKLRGRLLTTGEREFVEASPLDRIWGIGFAEEKALAEQAHWGLNLLGKALNETRRILREEGW